MLEVLEQLQLTVRPLREHGSAEGLHNLLDGDILAGKLVFRGAGKEALVSIPMPFYFIYLLYFFPGEDTNTYQTKPKAPMPTGWRSEYLVEISQPDFPVHNFLSYLEVISKVVPKIWARTNSAMAGDVGLFCCACFKIADDDAEVRGNARCGGAVVGWEGEIDFGACAC
jgi:hypothetical protein